MADSVTEAQSQDRDRGGRSVTGMDGERNREKNNSLTGSMEMQGVGAKL